MNMDILTPKSFDSMYKKVKTKTDDELVKMMLDKFDIIASNYTVYVDGEIGFLLLIKGTQMACDGMEPLPEGKKKALAKVFSKVIETDDQINEIITGYEESDFDTLRKITRIFESDDITKDTFSYLIGVACVGGENTKGISNIKRLFEAWFI